MKVRHVMIRASAGSGKTHALTNRFIELLAGGAAPDRIVALTFTRKAAGEFFDEILWKLARGAGDPAAAAMLAEDLGSPQLRSDDFLRMLRAVVDAMPRLRLGTLDSFFGKIARTFPLELGLAGDFEILQEHAAHVERRRVLQRMFAQAASGARGKGDGGANQAQREFIEAFRRATFGSEEKGVGGRLDAFLDEHHERYLVAPDADLWGNPRRIWPAGCAWLASPPGAFATAIAELRERLGELGLAPGQLERWEAFLGALPEWSPGATLPDAVEYLLNNTLAVWPDVQRGAAEVTVDRRKVALGPEECHPLAAIVTGLVAGELTRRLEITRGIHAVLDRYEAVYHETVRREGKLTFGDVQRLLLPDGHAGVLAGPGQGGEARLLLDYRLDGQFDHWLLDEFQDTSFGQWCVLANLIDEAVQDPAHRKTFFCVGDVKQAIFTWREGDPRLFRDILERYNQAAPGTIVERKLVKSWRSGPAIIEMVNAVFGGRDAIDELLPGAASATWHREWLPHESAVPIRTGYAAWWHAVDEPERLARTAEVLKEIDPHSRGLECAVLVRSNAMAATVADYLRRDGGIPATAESENHVGLDNPLGAALLALVRMAAHPGDTEARELVASSPLGSALEEAGLMTPAAVTLDVLTRIHAEGFAQTIEHWLRRLEERLAPNDAFSRERGKQLVAAAAQFDVAGSRDIEEFCGFMDRHVVRELESAGTVRVMTIHRSKGLGFDVVILPDLEGQRLDQRREGLAVQRASDRSVEWVLDLPPKAFYLRDSTLREHVRLAEAESGYEALALLYVGLTRAKRGMYVITSPPRKSVSRNYPRLLASTLGSREWGAGDPRWFETIPVAGAGALPAEGGIRPTAVTAARAPRRVARRPSAHETAKLVATRSFVGPWQSRSAAELGSAIHGLLAQVEWGGSMQTAQGPARLLPTGAAEEAAACLAAPLLAHVWQKPERGEVWRERPFEILIDGTWVSGVFDRVVVSYGEDGRVRDVWVFDFKTDRIEGEELLPESVRHHAPQMEIYRRTAAVLTGLPPGEVHCELVFTFLRRTVVVSPR